MIRMMATTISSSISEKPLFFFISFSSGEFFLPVARKIKDALFVANPLPNCGRDQSQRRARKTFFFNAFPSVTQNQASQCYQWVGVEEPQIVRSG
jgi:hypothetical protein